MRHPHQTRQPIGERHETRHHHEDRPRHDGGHHEHRHHVEGRRRHAGGPDHGHGEHGHGDHIRGGGRGGGRFRVQRGDVRTATLLLLSEGPMHGYQLMQAMAERTGGAWRPSPGAIYPTIAQLEDEGLVTTVAEGGRKLVTLTPEGEAHIAERRGTWTDPFANVDASHGGPDLRGAVHELHGAARQVGTTGTVAQQEAAIAVLRDARRALYLILAGGDDA